MNTSKKSLTCCIALASLVGFAGCGLLDATNGIEVQLPEQSFAFSFDSATVKTALQTYLNELGSPYNLINVNQVTDIPSQVGQCPGSPPACQTVPRITKTFDIALPGQTIDVSNDSDLKNALKSGTIKSVKIVYVTYKLTTNSFNYNLPAFELYMDDANVTSIQSSSKKVATLPAITAKTTTLTREIGITADGRKIMSDYALKLRFSILGKSQLTLDTDINRAIPSGSLAGAIGIKLKFTVDPL